MTKSDKRRFKHTEYGWEATLIRALCYSPPRWELEYISTPPRAPDSHKLGEYGQFCLTVANRMQELQLDQNEATGV